MLAGPMPNPGAACTGGRQTGDRDKDRHNMLNIYSGGYGGEREKGGQREREREEMRKRQKKGKTGRHACSKRGQRVREP